MTSNLTDQQIEGVHAQLERLLYELKKVIVGQERLLERLLVAVLCQGHVLVEGAPGLAKTLTLKSLAQVLSVEFKRIQFTPDLLPADLLGTRIYNPVTGKFSTERGPLFANFILADEINRAPAKVQSALLEAMQEGQITLGNETFTLHTPFFVMATQNPLESEGTYPLPEAQLDRFLFKLLVTYPEPRDEVIILQRANQLEETVLQSLLDRDTLLAWTQLVKQVYVDPEIQHYMVDLVHATRDASNRALRFGSSPRGTLSLHRSSQALALLRGRSYVTPDDVEQLVHDCLRHRLLLSYEGLAEGLTSEQVLDHVLANVPKPQVARSS
jgi:MoxR-like ATPase